MTNLLCVFCYIKTILKIINIIFVILYDYHKLTIIFITYKKVEILLHKTIFRGSKN